MAKSPQEEHPVKAFGWVARDASGHLSPFNFSRRATGDEDVRFKVLYCGICYSDLHAVKDVVGISTFPLVPGKMIAGSASGGMKEMQEMIDFAARHNITADIEVVSMEYVNTAMERLAKNDVRY